MCTTNDYWRFVQLLKFSGKWIVGRKEKQIIKANQGDK